MKISVEALDVNMTSSILKEKSNLPGSIFPFKFYFDKPNDMYNRTT